MKRPKLLPAFHRLSVAVAFLCVVFASQQLSADVVVNGTFDDETTGWTGTWFSQDGSSTFPEFDTANYYWGGDVASNTITQVYDLAPADITELMSAGLGYEMNADLFGFSSQGDKALYTVELFDSVGATGTSLGSIVLDGINPGTWGDPLVAGVGDNFQSTSGTLDSGTRSLLVSIHSDRVSGTSNDGYADNVRFSFTAVPEPSAAIVVLGLGFVLTLVRCRND